MHSHTGNVVSHCVLRNWTCSHKFWFFDNFSPVKRLISIFSSIHLLKCGSLMIWTYLFWNWTLWLLTEIPGSALLNLSLSIAFIIPAFIIHCLYYPLPLLSIAFIIHCLYYPLPLLSNAFIIPLGKCFSEICQYFLRNKNFLFKETKLTTTR